MAIVVGSTAVNVAWGRGPQEALSRDAYRAAQVQQMPQDTPPPGLPPETAGQPSPHSEPIMRAYPCPKGEADAIADRLQREFGFDSTVRIAADPRTSQVLVLAAPGIHAKIAELGQVLLQERAQSNISRIEAPAVSQDLQFLNTTGQQVEARLLGMLGGRLITSAGPSTAVARYRLPLAGGSELVLSIDRRNHHVRIEGPAVAARSCTRLIQMIDQLADSSGRRLQLVSLNAPQDHEVRRAVDAIRRASALGPQNRTSAAAPVAADRLVTMLFQPPSGTEPALPPAPNGDRPVAGPQGPAAGEGLESQEDVGGLIGPVEIQFLEGLDIIVLRGREDDVAQVRQLIEQIEQLSQETQPAIEVVHLRQADSTAVSEIVTQIYQEVFASRQGAISITPLVKPNAVLLVGRPENVQTATELIRKLDRPVSPGSQFQIFRLEHASADTVATTIGEFYAEREGLGAKVRVTAHYRSNALIVQASPRDLAEVAAMVARLDTPGPESVNEIRLIQLQNSVAEDVAAVLLQAIQGSVTPGAGPQGQAAGASQKAVSLRFLKVDARGQQLLSSGILSEVQITAEARSNALLVSAPAASMPLIEALVRELDRLPPAEAQIKVFEIVEGDAQSLVEMLETLFGDAAAGIGDLNVDVAVAEGESTLVPLRFSVDIRTNSIIASGTVSDLVVVEAILTRLDEVGVRNRQSKVFRLKNAPADAVSEAINNYLRSERQVEQLTPGVLSPFEQIEREVVVVPEVVSNSLIVSATPRYFEDIVALVEQLDEQPPMVMIQVLIAQVSLRNTDEFGVEMGLQSSVLFDRSLLENIVTTTQSESLSTNQGVVTTTTEVIQSATNTPGFNFNNQPLGNSGAANALADAGIVGAQGLGHFALGRTNNELGFGGLVLSASSESVSVLLRALQECRRLEVLSRPQIMTLDNQPAFIQVGQRVPRITGVQFTETGQQNNVVLDNVGLILGVRPRISPDGLVVMEIDAERSEVGPESEGIPISINLTGEVIRSPRIDTTTAQTTVAALSGQTIVLGGLISKSKTKIHRRVPLLADIPILGELFRYDLAQGDKTELLIIMTPHIIESPADADRLKQVEAARIHWCLSDVIEMHGDPGIRSRTDEWYDEETPVIYPDGLDVPEAVPTPDDPLETVPILPDEEGEVPFRLEPMSSQRGKGRPEDGAPAVSPSVYHRPMDSAHSRNPLRRR